MPDPAVVESLRLKWLDMRDELDEPGRRRWCAVEARQLGYGGATAVHWATGVARSTINKGLAELKAGFRRQDERQRKLGGGRKSLEVKDERLVPSLEALIEPGTRGDPESPLRYTTKSVRTLATELTAQDHPCSAQKVSELLHDLGYSLQATSKTIEGKQHPDRDAQFQFINKAVSNAIENGIPAISVDSKKKELVGPFENGGKQWRPKGDPIKVLVHEFPDDAVGKAIPYGVLDIGKNRGWVNVGVDHDTPKFAVRSIEAWWDSPIGSRAYPDAKELFITADAGGSNSYRFRSFKAELQRFADERRIVVHVSHFPPGTSKWNKIEHHLFSHISRNWRGEPLACYETIIGLISATKTTTGLVVGASLDQRAYPKGVTVTKKEFASLIIEGNEFHPEWNYTIRPRESPPTYPTVEEKRDDGVIYGRRRSRSWWLTMVEKQRASGLTEREFCERRGFKWETLRWWRAKLMRDGLLKKRPT